MHIVFWSCIPGHAAVTSSMLSIACSCAATQLYNTAILQTQFKKNNLQYPFFKLADKENVEQYNSVGMDSLIRSAKGGTVTGGVETCAISFMDTKLNLFTQSTNKDGRAYYNGLLDALPLVTKCLDSTFDISFIDTAAGNDPLSIAAMKQADVIVICLPQEEWIINYFFTKYNLNSSKVFYLFGNYDKASNRNLGTLRHDKRYKKILGEKNTAFISHDTDFANALNTSDLISFFLHGLHDKKNPNYEYFDSVDNATRKLLAFAGVVPRK